MPLRLPPPSFPQPDGRPGPGPRVPSVAPAGTQLAGGTQVPVPPPEANPWVNTRPHPAEHLLTRRTPVSSAAPAGTQLAGGTQVPAPGSGPGNPPLGPTASAIDGFLADPGTHLRNAASATGDFVSRNRWPLGIAAGGAGLAGLLYALRRPKNDDEDDEEKRAAFTANITRDPATFLAQHPQVAAVLIKCARAGYAAEQLHGTIRQLCEQDPQLDWAFCMAGAPASLRKRAAVEHSLAARTFR